jgi:dipeptidyl aminopeptidase/acylaminoacyl peptidase
MEAVRRSAWDDTDLTRNGMYTVRASDGGDLLRMTTCPNSCHDIPTDYSPDGRQIVFTRQKLPDEADITLMVVNVDGSDAHMMSDQEIGGGRWSPDGKTILADANGSLLLLPIDGSATHHCGSKPVPTIRSQASIRRACGRR